MVTVVWKGGKQEDFGSIGLAEAKIQKRSEGTIRKEKNSDGYLYEEYQKTPNRGWTYVFLAQIFV